MRRILHLLLTLALVLSLAPAAGATGYAVVGGQAVEEGAHPSVVALARAEEPDDVAGQMCGGTAIAEDLVLTAAHCLHDADVTTWRAPEQIRVVAGRTDLSAQGGVERIGTEVFVHPSYDPRRRRFDVAVLRTDGPLGVPLQRLVAPDAAGPFGGDRATVVGWGRTGPDPEHSSSSTAVLREATVRVSEDTTCRAAFEGSLDLQVQLCAGGDGTDRAPAADACRGDSGGPLLIPDAATGEQVQHGITSFGSPRCGIDEPGVYTRLSAMRDFVDDVVHGRAAPTDLPEPEPAGRLDPVRVAAEPPTTPIEQAVAASRAVFADGGAELAVIARDDGFADALAGSSLGNGRGPLLFTSSSGALHPATRGELERSVPSGSTIYLLGGSAAVPTAVEQQLKALGYDPVRLAGETREGTAAAVAGELSRRQGDHPRPPYGTAVLATAQSWPDAVVAGQLGAWWGYPILLTPPNELHPSTRQALQLLEIDRLLIVGGTEAVSQGVQELVGDLRPRAEVVRLSGSNRTATAIEVAAWQRAELTRVGEPAPDATLVTNIRADDGYAHMLSATAIIAATAGVFLPVEGAAGDVLTAPVLEAFCGTGGLPLVVGGPDVVTEAVAQQAADVLAGVGC